MMKPKTRKIQCARFHQDGTIDVFTKVKLVHL